MSPEQRSDIENGIWLCQSCSVLVDRDEERFTVEELRRIKYEHEASRRLGRSSSGIEDDVIAIGPDIIALGRITRSDADGIRVRLSHIVNGSGRDLWSLNRDFEKWRSDRRYVLFNELGYGALLADPPMIERVDHGFEVQFKLQPQAPRQNATDNITAINRETGGWIRGLDAYIQGFESVLGLAEGSWFADLDSGSDLSDLYWRYHGSPWFERMVKMEMIRLSSIPKSSAVTSEPRTPFRIVNRVNKVEVPNFDLNRQKLTIMVDFDLEGLGQWSHALSIFISTPEELVEYRERARHHSERLQQMKSTNRQPL